MTVINIIRVFLLALLVVNYVVLRHTGRSRPKAAAQSFGWTFLMAIVCLTILRPGTLEGLGLS